MKTFVDAQNRVMSLFEKSQWPQRGSTEKKQTLPWLPYFVMATSRQQKRATDVFFSVVLRFSPRFPARRQAGLWANSKSDIPKTGRIPVVF
jgi:hypothetical protein